MSADFDFTNKVVLVTGSSGGLGSVIAKEFAKRGANVVITGRRRDALDKVAAECAELSPNNAEHLVHVADITDNESLKSLLDATIDKFGNLHVLVNNAGGGNFSSIYSETIHEDFENMMKLNLYPVVKLTQLAVPHLEKTNGSIINISSLLSVVPMAPFIAYCSAKAALDMFTKCIAIELGPKGIRVNYVSPTAIRTNFQASTGHGDVLAGVLDSLEQKVPLRHLPKELDVANAVLFLASDKSSSLTGININVDSGNNLVGMS